jgi:Coenzyme PQQ synthesis protein D (PqqD)
MSAWRLATWERGRTRGILLEMKEVSLASTVCHTPNPVAADVAGETVLMSLERSRCYGLGGIGSEIWSKLESPVRVGDLVAELSESYEAPPGVIEREVLQLLAQLADEGLIQIS